MTMTSEAQANVAPAASAKGKQEQSSQTEQPQKQQQQQQQQQRAPKLAPAPVPQQTPWKATPIEHSTDLSESKVKSSVVAAAVAAASSSKNSNNRDVQSNSGSNKRATTGKEKWVPFAPVPIPAQQTPSSNGSSSSGNRNRQGKRQQNNGGQNGGQNGNSKGRRNMANNDKRLRGAGHQRSQSRARTDDNSGNNNNSANNNNNGNNGSNNSSASSSAGNSNSGSNAAQVDVNQQMEKLGFEENNHRRNQPNQYPNQQRGINGNGMRNQTRKGPRMVNANRMPYYQPGFIPAPGAVPYGMPIPMVPMAPVMPAATPNDYLLSALVLQVDYYFSTENLCKDMFLRKNMNNEGLVPLSVIANFNRVKLMAPNIELVGQACTLANNIEIIGSKLRAVNNWQHWILPESERLPNGLDNSTESVNTEQEPKFQVDQAVPFVPKSEK